MKTPLLKIAVVGHTNTGKTSLVRTLTRNRKFGQVMDRGGTTRQIVSTELRVEGRPLIELYDSPGLENAPELIEWMDQQPGDRHDGPARIDRLLRDSSARNRFDQEARVLELLRAVDVGLYVIDAREPVLEKYQDELAILGQCARPLVAVLNFTASDASLETQWREALAGVTLHTVMAFDVTVRDPASEQRLFEKLKSQLDRFVPTLDAWLDQMARDEDRRLTAATRTIAALLMDAAAARRRIHASPDNAAAEELAALQAEVRRREQACVETLLDLYRFSQDDYQDHDLPLADGRWEEDLFDPETLRRHGISAGKHLGMGAGAGAVFDVATGGLSLGAGTLIGALAGSGVGLVRGFGGRAIDRLRGLTTVAIDDAALALLHRRQCYLLQCLRRRGHASQVPVRANATQRPHDQSLPVLLRRARHHPAWSSLNQNPDLSGRESTLTSLARELRDTMGG